MLKIFTIKFENRLESFNDNMVSDFLADKEIIRWESTFFQQKNNAYWSIPIIFAGGFLMGHLFRVRAVTGSNRVLRGGSWGNNAWNCRAAYRNDNHPANRNANIGFRLASSLLRQESIVQG